MSIRYIKLSSLINFIVFILLINLFSGCDSSENSITEDPYAGGKPASDIQFTANALPSPSSGEPGDTIVFKVKGLLQWCNPATEEYDFDFYIADEKTEVVAVTDAAISVVVPENVSSGISHILLRGQEVFYGPKFTVNGNITVDEDYYLQKGSSDVIYNYLKFDNSQYYYLIGAFTKWENQTANRIAVIDDAGKKVMGWHNTYYHVDGAVFNTISQSDYLRSISYFNNVEITTNNVENGKKLLISGSFDTYKVDVYKRVNEIANIVSLRHNAYLDTMKIVLPGIEGNLDQVIAPRFNGGTLQPIIRSFITKNDEVIAVGNLSIYRRIDYSKSTLRDRILEYKPVFKVIKMTSTGALVEGYRSSRTGLGTSGSVNDACMDEDDGVVVVGDFISFDGKTANRIVRLEPNGTVDETYLANTGSGADGSINTIQYNQKSGLSVITGNFTQFDGTPRNGIAVIDKDGTLNEGFAPKEISGGKVNFATILNRGKIVVSGTFTKYAGISRPGFLILDMDGQAIQGFNVPGTFSGQLYQVVETETTTGHYGLLLLGSISRFNGSRVSNVVRIEVDFEEKEK
jgi:hypothetical protein